MTKSLNACIREYIEERFNKKKDKLSKVLETAINKATSPDAVDSIKRDHEAALINSAEDFKAANWLDSATKRASQIKIATHTSSYPNSSANGANVIAADFEQRDQYVDTGSLSTPVLDFAGNAAAFDIGSLLLLSDENKTLLDYVLAGDTTPLESFAKSAEQAEIWIENLSKAVNSIDLNSHVLSRQVYFPIGNEQYHLLAPLYPLSLAYHLHKTINHCRYSEEMVLARKARRASLSHNTPVVAYPDLAVRKLGGSKPQNVSSLNSKRGGYNYLLPSTPPKVKTEVRRPNGCLFQSFELKQETREQLKNLTKLLVVSSRMESGVSHIRSRMESLVEEIIDISLNLSFSWSTQETGWTDASGTMPHHQKIWLDRKNPSFSDEERSWKSNVSTDFAIWLVSELNQLSGSAFTLGQAEVDIWANSFLTALEMTE